MFVPPRLLSAPLVHVVTLLCLTYVGSHCRRAFELINSVESHEKQGGILAVDELIDIQVKEADAKTIRFANFLRAVFPSATADAETLRLASKALGACARVFESLLRISFCFYYLYS